MKDSIRSLALAVVTVTAIIVVVSAGMSGVNADSETNFTVTMDTSDAVDGNDNLAVDVTVTNKGNVSGEQQINLTDGSGIVQDSTNVSLDAGQSKSVTLTWRSVPVPEANPAPDYGRTITPKVQSGDDADSTVVTVRWEYFSVDNITPPTKTIVEGNAFDIETTIQNVGTLDGTQDVKLLVNGTQQAVKPDTSIGAEGSTELTFSSINPGLDPGTYNYTVETAQEKTNGTLTVLEAAQFTVISLDAVYKNDQVTVDAEIKNEESIAAEQPVALDVDGREIKTQNISLAAGAQTDVTFTYDPESVPLNATVETALDTASIQVGTVEITSMGGTHEDGTITVETVIENKDPAGTEQTVVFEADGQTIEEQSIFLQPGEQRTLTVTHETTALPVNVTALTAIDAASTSVPTANIENGPTVEAVTPERLDVGSAVTVTYTASGVNLDQARLRVEAPDGSRVLDKPVDPGVSAEYTLSQAALPAYIEGEYDVTLWVKDEFGGTESHTLDDAFEATAVIENSPKVERVTPDTVQVDETVSIEYSATGINMQNVTVKIDGPDGNVVFEQTVKQGVGEQIEINPRDIEGIEDGPHDVTVAMTDVFGNVESDTIEGAFDMKPVYNPDNADFGTTASSPDVAGAYEGTAGDFVTVSVALNEIEQAYIIVGGDRAADESQSGAPLDILHVSGSATFVINTRLVGTDRPSEEVYIPVEGDVTSYAQELGPDAKPTGVFEGLQFQNQKYEQIAETLTGYRKAANSGVQARPLQPGSDVSMVIGGGDSVIVNEDGVPDARFPLDRATIALTEPELTNVTTYRLPTGTADERSFQLPPDDSEELTPGAVEGLLDSAQPAGTIARNDRLLIEVNATGFYGSLLDSTRGSTRIGSGEPTLVSPSEFKTLLDRPEGIELSLSHLNAGRNVPPTTVDLFEAESDDVSILLNPGFAEDPTAMEQFYVLVDTRGPEPFSPTPADGARFEVNMSYTPPQEERYRFSTVSRGVLPDPFNPEDRGLNPPPFPYLSPESEKPIESSTFTITNRTVEYDRTNDDGEPIVANGLGATLSGTTTLAPGTDLPVNIVIDVIDESTKVEINNVAIDESGNFSVNTDLSMLEPDEEVTIEFWAYQEKLDERSLAVVEKDNVSGEYEVTDLTADSVVTTNGTLVEMSGVVTNTGLLSDNKTVDLILDAEVVANKTVELAPGESRTMHFEDALDDLEPGQYPLELRTPDDFEGVLLVVDESDGVFEVADINATSTVTDGEAGLAFETTVRNTGTINETGTVELLRDGEVVAERTADLLVGQDVSYSFTDELTELGPGNYTLTVRTPDEQETVDVSIKEPVAVLELDGVDVPSSIQQGTQIAPKAVVNNTGTATADGPVTIALGGESLGERTVELSAGENTTVAFDEVAIGREPGTYTLRVETPDDEITVELVVEGGDDTESNGTEGQGEDSDGNDAGGADGDGTSGVISVFGVGVGRGALIGGSALVGGIHVLGYWI
ncbi:hypothetical protein ACFQJ7_00950 [Halovenus rubra]|uniref:Uncharacterized protein n=2 Tax=Halovenus rubra TaxID=869890 RepID=A0ACC7E148_9EURY|nr:hypothetical protein [Halovenus rubra]